MTTSRGFSLRLVLLSALLLALTGCYTTGPGRYSHTDVVPQSRELTSHRTSVSVTTLPSVDDPTLTLTVEQRPVYQVETVRMHEKLRKNNHYASTSLFLGSIATGITYLAVVPSCHVSEDKVCSPDQTRRAESKSSIGWAAAGMFGASLVAFLLEDDSTYTPTGSYVEGRRGLKQIDGKPAEVGFSTVTLRVGDVRYEQKADANGRVSVDLVRDFGLSAFERPSPIMLTATVSQLEHSETISLDPRKWTVPHVRISRNDTPVYDRPGSGTRIATIPQSEEVRTVTQSGDWIRIERGGLSGWIRTNASTSFWAFPTRLDPNRLPRLSAEATLSEPSGNSRIDGDERGEITVAVTNRGEGPAYRVRAAVSPGPDPMLHYPETLDFGDVSPGGSATATLPLEAQRAIETGNRTLTLTFQEANGFEPAPIRVHFETAAFVPPNLKVVDVAVGGGNGDGIIQTEEIVTVDALVQNASAGNARDVTAQVNLGSGDLFFPDASDRSFDIGDLGPGESRRVQFRFFANPSATELPISISLREAYGEFGTENPLRLTLNTPTKRITDVRVEGKDVRMATGIGQSVTPEIERNLPRTVMDNPDAVAVVIGIRDYQNPQIPSVKFARRDAETMRMYLTEVLGFREENILPRNPDEFMTVGKMRQLIRHKLPAYLKGNQSDLFVYFSGHGAPSLGENPEAYLVPADADPNFVSDETAYRLSHFYEDLTGLGARSLTVVLDACFSGQSGDGEMLIRNASPLVLTAESPLLASENSLGFLASGSAEVASWYPDKSHGLFTYFFLLGLQGEANFNGDDRLTTAELQAYLTDERNGVPYWAGRLHQRTQTPQVVGTDLDRVLVRYAK